MHDYFNITRDDAADILNVDENLSELLDAAYTLRKKYKGNVVKVQLLTNVRSGNCSENCAYCAQSGHNDVEIQKYRLVAYDKLMSDGKTVRDKKLVRHCIGFSGIRFGDKEVGEFAAYVRGLKSVSDADICCSVGFLTESQARVLKDAGVNRINHNLNSSRRFYPNICTTHSYDDRINNILMLKRLGFEICCGGIAGMGESRGDVVDMLFEIKNIAPASVPINFLVPIDGTAVDRSGVAELTPEYCLKILCLARLLNPAADIRAAAGREIYLKGYEKEMFRVVDSVFASGYLTVGGQSPDDTIKLITDLGFDYAIE
ncbi:MAG: biotin synthase BioB [Clostridiaceae bacterium]|jgi:biotin synthase|nr:biotin synthase BioB [Clostridiaceae bacterium]